MTGFNALTSGTGLSIASTATGLTGALSKIELSGSNAGNTGFVSKIGFTGTTGTAVALDVTNGGTGSSFVVNDDGTYTDTSAFLIDSAGNVGIGQSTASFKLDVKNSTNSYVMRVLNTATSNAQKGILISLTIANSSRTANSRFIDFADSGGNVAGNIQGNGAAVAYQTAGADYAEYFGNADVNNPPDAAEVVSFGNNSQSVKRTNSSADQQAFGIISSGPGFIGNGPICKVGDDDCQNNFQQTNSTVALAGQVPLKVSTENGSIQIGDFLTSSSTAGVAMKATHPGQMIARALENYSGSSQGTIKVLVYNGYADPTNTLANLSLDSSGSLITPPIKTQKLELTGTNAQLVVNGTSIDPTTLLQAGQLASSVNSLQNQVQSLADNIASLNSAQQTLDSRLSTLDSNTNVLGTQVASQSAQIADVNSQVASQSANLANLSGQQASDSASLAALKAELEDLKTNGNNLTPVDPLLATDSATIGNLNVNDKISTLKLDTIEATVSGTFKSLGETFLGNTTIAGDLSVDGTFSINNGNSINALPTLFIQNGPLAQLVDFFNGLVTIDKNGLVQAKTIATDQIKINADKSAGEATLQAGQTEVAVFNNLTEDNSIVIITPETNTTQNLAVTGKVSGSGFVVSVPATSLSDIKFSYLIVGQNPSP
jgi:hypothetical protein